MEKAKTKCVNCGCIFKLSRIDRIIRTKVKEKVAIFPTLKTILEDAKDYCNDCWKARVKPAAEQLSYTIKGFGEK